MVDTARKETNCEDYHVAVAVERIQPVRRTFRVKSVLLATVLSAASIAVFAHGQPAQKSRARHPDLTAGKDTFTKYCASCHGVSGKGDVPRPGRSSLRRWI